MTATMWDEANMNPNGWWMTEKYDGMRVYWNGSQFLTRQGNVIKVPNSVRMPNIHLDGEMWYNCC
jgi:DNA ligase-1